MYSVTKLHEGESSICYYQTIPKKLKVTTDKFETLWKLHPSEYSILKIYGKDVKTPRYIQNYGYDYQFSGVKHKSIPTPEILQVFIDWINQQEPSYNYNGMLVNWYENGNHYIGAHSDDEKELVKNAPIYCFSFGEERDFVVTSKETNEKKKYKLQNNSLLMMCGDCQTYYKHSIPKSKKLLGQRISITVRAFK